MAEVAAQELCSMTFALIALSLLRPLTEQTALLFQDPGYSLLCYISSLHTSLVCTSFHIYSIVKIKVGHYACWPIPLANTYLPNFAFFPSFPQLSLLLASQSAYRCLLGRKSFLCMFLDQLVQLPPPWSFLLVSSHIPPKYLPWA